MKISQLSNKRLTELASKTELQVDKQSGIIFGRKQGYDVCLRVMDTSYKSLLSFAVSKNEEAPQNDDFIQLTKETKGLESCNVSQNSVSFVVSAGLTKGKSIEKIINVMNTIIEFLQVNGYENCCEVCGKKEDISSHMLNGSEVILCSNCFNDNAFSNEVEQKNENMLAGAVGSLIGAVIGVIAIVIIGQLGYVAAISGIIMAVCTLKGYEMLGGKLSNKGIVISCIIMIIMVYVGCRFDWAVTLKNYYGIDIFTAFNAVSDMYVEMSYFYKNLVMLYVFALVGAVPTVWREIRYKSHGNIAYKMESNI